MEDIQYSFVIPCYRSQNTIRAVVDEIKTTMANMQCDSYEIVLVNDCSPDEVWSVIKNMAAEDTRIKGMCLARNFGQHAALMAGYKMAMGQRIVSLDDDGQIPIDELPSLTAKMDEGYDVVFAYYEEIKQRLYRRMGTKIAKKMDEVLIGTPREHKFSSFFVFRNYVKEEIVRYKGAYPYVLGLIYRATKNVACVPTKHRSRMEGKSGYSLKALFKLWFNGFSSFSAKPLEVSAYIGALVSGIGFIYAIYLVIRKLTGHISVAGWSSLICINLILSGIILLTLGLIGEYVGRIYISINNAPQYVVRETTESEMFSDAKFEAKNSN